jgi:hypothetical protein
MFSLMGGNVNCLLIFPEIALVCPANRCSPRERTLANIPITLCFGCGSLSESGFSQMSLKCYGFSSSEYTCIELFRSSVIMSKTYKKVWEIECNNFLA